MGQFINGLKEEIKSEVRLLNPLNLDQAMGLAVRVEERNRVNGSKKFGSAVSGSIRVGSYSIYNRGSSNNMGGSGSGPGTNVGAAQTIGAQTDNTTSKAWSNSSSPTNSQSSVNFKATSPSTTRFSGEVKRLTEKELQEKKEKGLCFRCDGKWGIGHRCPRKELSVLLVEEEDEPPLEEEFAEEEELVPTEVSLCSVVGLTNPKTMKLVGEIGGKQVIVMIDPGATHNFISLKAVEKIGLPVTKTGGFGVSLGNGEAVKGTGACKGVLLELKGGVMIQEDFLPLDLGNSDVILGIQWLEKLGSVVTNWKTQSMKFSLDGQTVTLKGEPALARSKISLKAMMKTIRKEGQGVLVELNQMENGPEYAAGVGEPARE